MSANEVDGIVELGVSQNSLTAEIYQCGGMTYEGNLNFILPGDTHFAALAAAIMAYFWKLSNKYGY